MNVQWLRNRLGFTLFCGLFFVSQSAVPVAGGSAQKLSVPACKGVQFSASYLSTTYPYKAPAFQFTVKNDTNQEIRFEEPMPSSSHWYALEQGRWLWRASNGAGGSLVDATDERKGLIVYQPSYPRIPGKFFSVKPHQVSQWIESEVENPVLAYNPRCPICSYPGERVYQVVFAYAYLPDEQQKAAGFVTCGVRTKPVPMPPKP